MRLIPHKDILFGHRNFLQKVDNLLQANTHLHLFANLRKRNHRFQNPPNVENAKENTKNKIKKIIVFS